MSLIFSSNPYRTLGVLSNSSARLVQQNLSKIKAFSKLNKSIDFELDLSFLNLAPIDRTLETASKAESYILLDINKIKYSLFWFQDLSSVDSIALPNLVKGDTEKALEIWARLTKSDEVNSKNLSAFNNAASLLFLLQLDNSETDKFESHHDAIIKLKQGIEYKLKIINSNVFEAYCKNLGVTSPINPDEILVFLADSILEIIQQNFTTREISNLVNGLDPSFAELINRNLVKGPISNIKDHLKSASDELERDNTQGLNIGKALIRNTVSDLKYLNQTLGKSHYQYEAIADKLSNQILQCGIVYFNKTGEDQSYLSSYKYALSIAHNDKTRARAKDCIKHCEEERIANLCWFCEKNQISPRMNYKFQMYKYTDFFRREYTYFKNGGLKIGCCETCRRRHDEIFFTTIYYYFLELFKGIKRPYIKSARPSSLIKHPIVQKHLEEGYRPGLPN